MSKNYFYGSHFITKDDILSVANSMKYNLSQGPILEKFEKNVSKYFKVKYCVAVSSATAGLHLAIKALNLESKSKVYNKNQKHTPTLAEILKTIKNLRKV